MATKKSDKVGPVYVFKLGKLKLTLRAIALIMGLGIFGTILIVNIGYDKQHGCYWKPADIKVDIKKARE